MATPQFVVIGHVVKDAAPGGWRLGGTATFAAVQAARLGLRAGIVTRVEADLGLNERMPEIAVAGRPSERTTTFENVYEGARRRQRVPVQADSLALEDVPDDWRRAPMMLLGPVCGEVPALGEAFPGALVGVSAQGWLRQIDRARRVRRRAWRGAPFWSGCDVLFVSDEDLGERRDQLDRWTADVPVVALTRDRRGARVHAHGRWRRIDAFPTAERDPTGAGDVFAAAFLARYYETKDVDQSTRFATAAAACSVEGAGVEAIATRAQIEQRMADHPEVVVR